MIEPTHEEFQDQVVKLMGYLGWQHLHVRKSVGRGRKWQTTTNLVGWPDIFGFHPSRGFCAIEIKVGKDKPTPEQVEVLASLAAAGARTMVAYPADLDAVKAMLMTGPA